VDNDGDTDVLIANNAGPARLLLNQVGQDAAWIGFQLVAGRTLDVYGAAVILETGGRRVLRRAGADGSYASSSDPRLVIGLGDVPPARLAATVTWPDGAEERFEGLETGTYHRLVRGRGTAAGE
jgi:hypothetical protein